MLLDHDGYLPSFIRMTSGKVHEIRVVKEAEYEFPSLPPDSILTVDRGYMDYQWLYSLREQGVTFIIPAKSNMAYQVVGRHGKPNEKRGVLSGACGEYAVTNPAILNVASCRFPFISVHPKNDTVKLNQAASFSVTAQGNGLTYKWKRNDNIINVANGPLYTIPYVMPFNNFDRYRVIVTNDCGKSSQSDEALLIIRDAEILAGRNGSMELVGPRLRLTAAPYAFTTDVKVIYGSGRPDTAAVNAPVGAMYIDRNDSERTWKMGKNGLVKLD